MTIACTQLGGTAVRHHITATVALLVTALLQVTCRFAHHAADAAAPQPFGIMSILVPWFAFQNQSELAAEALVDVVISLYRKQCTPQELQLELALAQLQSQSEGMRQLQALDRDLLLSCVYIIWLVCEVRGRAGACARGT